VKFKDNIEIPLVFITEATASALLAAAEEECDCEDCDARSSLEALEQPVTPRQRSIPQPKTPEKLTRYHVDKVEAHKAER